MTQDRKVWAITTPGCFFYRESCRRRAYRGSLSEACGGLEVVVVTVWGVFFTGRAAEEELQR